MTESEYFATRSAKEVISHIEGGRSNWVISLNRLGLRDRWRKSHNLYYGKHFDAMGGVGSTSILRTGAQGEIAAFAINHYRNLIKNTLALTCNEKPVFDVRAINTDSDSLQEARLANQVLESDWKFKHLGNLMRGAAERSQVYGKGFVFSYWDTFKGKPYSSKGVTDQDGNPVMDDKTGKQKLQIVHEGDMDDQTPNPWDVYTDQGVTDWRKNEWAEVGVFENRWNLMAKYPALAETIRGLPSKNEIELLRPFLFDVYNVETDQVRKYFWIHKRTMAMPNGRLIIHCGSDCILYDGPVPPPMDQALPLFRIVPGEIFDSQEGYSDAFDLQGIQEALNVLISTGFTNLQANGIQKLWCHPNADISASTLAKGLAIIRSQIKPEPLQLTANPQDLYTALQYLEKSAETISGINSVARGDPEHSLKSGIALAYVEAMASRYTSSFQASWATLNEETATFRIKNYQEYATTPRFFAMVGKRNVGYMGSFHSNKIKRVQTVVVDMGNPLTKSLAGRMEVADNLLQQGRFQTPQDYVEFIETGQFGTMMQDPYERIAAVEMENEALMQGKKITATVGEAHIYHAQKHLALISNPHIKMNAPYVQNVLEHAQEHIRLWRTQDPVFSMLAGEPAPPPPPPPPGPPGGPPQGPPPGPGGPPAPGARATPPGPPAGPPLGSPPHAPEHRPHHPPQPHGRPHAPHGAHHGGHAGPPPLSQIMAPPQPGQPPSGPIPRLPSNLQPGAEPPQPQ